MHECPHAAIHRVIAFIEQIALRCKADFAYSLLIRVPSRNCRSQMKRAADKGNTFVAQSGQMLHGLPYSMLIIDAYITDAGRRGSYIDKYKRHFAEAQVLN